MLGNEKYLHDLQVSEKSQGAKHLRTLLLGFAPTIERLPKLRQEIDNWLTNPDVNLDALAAQLEEQLCTATSWLLSYDMASDDIRNAESVKAFMQRAVATATSRTLIGISTKFSQLCSDPTATEFEQFGYVDHKDGTVSSTQFGLRWMRAPYGYFTWAAAVNLVSDKTRNGSVNFAKIVSWRIPNLAELETLLVKSENETPRFSKAIFSGIKTTEGLWSSEDRDSSYAYKVNLNTGKNNAEMKDRSLAVLLVTRIHEMRRVL